MYCINCGNKLSEGAKFCDKCGTKQEIAQNAESNNISTDSPVEQNKNKRNPNMKKWIILGVILIVLCAVGYMAYRRFTHASTMYKSSTSDKNPQFEKEIDEIIQNSIVISSEETYQQLENSKESLAEIPSDIKGMTKLDKYNMGLDIQDGSDTDQDGLTDKEEIEVYGTDPTKKSTSGDLYTDGYKIEHTLNVNEVYDYEGEKKAKNNKCSEVSLDIDDIADLSAVVEDITGLWQFAYADSTSGDWLGNLNILKEYRIYNYTGNLEIDLTDIVKESSISADKICALFVMENYANGWNKMLNQDYNCYVDGNTLIIEGHTFNSGEVLMLYEDTELARQSVNLDTSIFNGLINANTYEERNENEEGGDILITFNLFSALTRGRPSIRYTSTGNAEDDAFIIETAIGVAKWLSDADLDNDWTDPLEINSSHCKEISPKMYSFIDGFYRTVMPDFVNANWKNIITIIDTDVIVEMLEEAEDSPLKVYNYKNGMRYEVDKDKETQTLYDSQGRLVWKASYLPKEGFDIKRDRLPFGNFNTHYSIGGHCAGITQFMNIANNTQNIPETGVYTSKDGNTFSWNLLKGKDTDNIKLVEDRELILYKNSDFVENHISKNDSDRLISGLSQGELEFVNMIEAYHSMINDLNKYGKIDGKTNYSYELIEEMTDRLDNGQILGCGFILYKYNDGSKDTYQFLKDNGVNAPAENSLYFNGGHAVNIYDYKRIDDNTIYFYVYDSNIPDNNAYTGGRLYTEWNSTEKENELKPYNMYIRVTKKESSYDHKDTFVYMYQPLPEAPGYYISTNELWTETVQGGFTKVYKPKKDENMDPNQYLFAIWDETGTVISNNY